MKRYVLLTGATGLVGRYLLRDLLSMGHRLAVVARASEKEDPVERIEGIMQYWEQEAGTTLPRPVVLQGDITAPSFGFSEADIHWVREHCDRILNNAAVITFYGADRSGEPWRTNVTGTQNALQLCERVGISEFHHVSTAYVCGTRAGIIREDELDAGQRFRNDYEESKFLSERSVRSASHLRSLTVYRPAIIAGDSQTGYTSTYHGLYHHLKLMSVVNRNVDPDEHGRRHTPLQLPMSGEEPRNIVPVDWVSAVMCRIFSDPALHGRTYHLAPRQRVTVGEVLAAACEFFNSYGVEFVGKKPYTPAANDIYVACQDSIRLYEPYEDTDPEFDTSQLDEALPELPCPRIDGDMLKRFLKFGERDRWGKRRVPRPNVPFSVSKFLAEELTRHHPQHANGTGRQPAPVVVGLNVHGPGGGQWRLEFVRHRLTAVAPGLPADQACVSLGIADFSRLVHKEECLTADALREFAERNAGGPQEKCESRNASIERARHFPEASDVDFSWAVRRPLSE